MRQLEFILLTHWRSRRCGAFDEEFAITIDTKLIDGRPLAARLRASVAAHAASLQAQPGILPGLCTILVGEDPASEVYVRNKNKAASDAGFACFEQKLPASASEAELLALIARLNTDERIDGILVQLPLPPQIDAQHIIEAIDPAKDVDGLHPDNAGELWSGGTALIPCTPYACLLMLREGMPAMTGAEALVIGRSNIVGKPMAALLLRENCSVTGPIPKAAICPRSRGAPTSLSLPPAMRSWCAATGSSRVPWSSMSASTASTRATVERGSSAMSLSPKPKESPPRSHRCPAASAR